MKKKTKTEYQISRRLRAQKVGLTSLREGGFTLLLSLVVVSIVLSVGLGVFDIVFRELIFSGMSRESQKAFYAADTGAECALYWDIKQGPISSTTPSTISCANQNVEVGGTPVSSFQVNLSNGTCLSVTVDKTNDPQTSIESFGYNTACDSTSRRKVERAIKITY